MLLKIVRTTQPTSESVSIYFERTGLLKDLRAGQFGIFAFEIQGVRHVRIYSFHTPPGSPEPGITVRSVENGVVSNHLIAKKECVKVSLEGIGGEFVAGYASGARHLIMFAGGSGITPVFSIIQDVLTREQGTLVSLVYANTTYSRIIFLEQLDKLETAYSSRLKVYHVLTTIDDAPSSFPVYYTGRLTTLIVRKTIKQILSHVALPAEYYLCGPYGLMELVSGAISAVASGEQVVKRETFFVESAREEFDFAGLPDRDVIMQVNGEEKLIIVKGGKSILEAARENRVNVRYSCTEGQCGTCRAFVVFGEVKLRKNHVLTSEELKQGQTLMCQGFPMTDRTTIRVA